MKKKMQISIIGYGRFGKLWAEILSNYGDIFIFEKRNMKHRETRDIKFVELEEALQKETIFLCIPISQIEEFLKENKNKFSRNSTVIDTASVKELPIKWMDKYIPNIPHLGLHPLFGPDSYEENQVNLVIISGSKKYPNLETEWQKILERWHLFTRIVSASEHDVSIAYSQGMTHFVGNIIKKMELSKIETPTLGYSLLRSVEKFCENDTRQLFRDMLLYNQHSGKMFKSFLQATHEVSSFVRKENVDYNEYFTVGVMGARGSFSHESANQWFKKKHIEKGKIKYLVTAKKVFEALDSGKIKVGILPIQNAVGGVVDETILGLAKYECKIKEYFPFVVNQCLIKHKNNRKRIPKEIHSHPQALRQCKAYLAKHYKNIPLVKANDTALSARNLSKNKLDEDVFVIAPETTAELYDLKLVDKNIQDLGYNITDFVVVGKD
ncbi:MAG: prephenate dehydrogenase/arogenate dehydrogenase family protein [Candidatus Marinimicrobia bacterium]|nr:prephenate dehydrogenase/arogenate dehydrogenase family protein [Candidatus Neomarinimicrobiota bacterium]